MRELLSKQQIKALVTVAAELSGSPDYALSADEARKVLGVIERTIGGSAGSRSDLRVLKKAKRKFEERGCLGAAAAVDTLIDINLHHSVVDNWADRELIDYLRKALNCLVETTERLSSNMVKRMEDRRNGRIIPPVQLANDPLGCQVDTDKPVKIREGS